MRVRRLRQHLEGGADRADVIFGQRARIGSWIGQDFVPLIKTLGQSEGVFSRETEPPVCLALQTGQIVEQRRKLGGRLALFSDFARFAQALAVNRFGRRPFPESLGLEVGIPFLFFLRKIFVKPPPDVFPGLRRKGGVQFEVIPRHKLPDLLLALNHDGERWRLHAAHGCQLKAAGFGIERRHGARAIDAHQPVGFRTAHRGVSQGTHQGVLAQCAKAFADRGGSH